MYILPSFIDFKQLRTSFNLELRNPYVPTSADKYKHPSNRVFRDHRDKTLEFLSMAIDFYGKALKIYEDKLLNGARSKEWEREYIALVKRVFYAVRMEQKINSSKNELHEIMMEAATARRIGADNGPPKFDEEEKVFHAFCTYSISCLWRTARFLLLA